MARCFKIKYLWAEFQNSSNFGHNNSIGHTNVFIQGIIFKATTNTGDKFFTNASNSNKSDFMTSYKNCLQIYGIFNTQTLVSF